MSEPEQQPEGHMNAEKSEHVTQTQEPTTSYADIIVFCHPRNIGNLVQSFENEIKHAAGDLPMFVLWSGVSSLLHQGAIVLEWEGRISPAFLHNLSIDHEIFDFVVYEWTSGDDAKQNESEPHWGH